MLPGSFRSSAQSTLRPARRCCLSEKDELMRMEEEERLEVSERIGITALASTSTSTLTCVVFGIARAAHCTKYDT